MYRTVCRIVLAVVCAVSSAAAAPQVGPLAATGEIKGAPYRIQVPANWNGTLLVYGHGYRDKADHPGEVDNRAAELAPSAALEAPLLAAGYALAGSAYRDNGWAVDEGVQDLKNLVTYFRDNVARPDRTILWAFSMGSVISLTSMERFGGIYDGALAGCAVGAGTSRSFDGSGDLLLGYDVVFGLPAAWGSVDDVRDDIDFETEVLAKLVPELSNVTSFPKFEFLRLVVGTPGRGIAPPPPPAFYPGWVLTDMFFATEARAELERRARGPIVQNLDRFYDLTPPERAYLAALGVPGEVVDAWLNSMNARRNIEAPPYARNYLARNADYSGRISKPVLTMHTLIDPLVTVTQENAYAALVEDAGRSKWLYQVYTNGNGHCAFTGTQLLGAIVAVDSWVRTGVKPTAGAFPAALGFLPGFVPPPMNQP